jgi:ribosomal protein S18 acetylase RimI-like enzyme
MVTDITTRRAAPADLPAALAVWRAANEARGKLPDEARVARVSAKLAGPAAVVVVAIASGEGDTPAGGEVAGDVAGMALAEPGRAEDGAGELLPTLWHVSMVFVDPARWGRRIGELLLAEVAARAARAGVRRLGLWTGERNERAQRLYRRAGFVPTGRVREHGGEQIIHLERTL